MSLDKIILTEKPTYKTGLPLFKLNLFILPIIFLIFCFGINADEMTFLAGGILLFLCLRNLSSLEYNLFPDKITIYSKNLIWPFKTLVFELPLNRLKEIEFEKGHFDLTTFFIDIIARFFRISSGRSSYDKATNDHVVTITWFVEFTNEELSEAIKFDHRFTELEGIIKKTKPLDRRTGKANVN